MLADTVLLLPEVLLLLGAVASLLAGSFTPRRRQGRVRALAAGSVAASMLTAAVGLAAPASTAFSGTATIDAATGVARLVVGAALLLVLLLAGDEVAGHPRESELCTLLLLSGTGTLLLASAADLALLVAAFLLTSLPLYAVIGLLRRPGSAEAAVKTYLFGALFGIWLMLGAALLYALAGTTAYADLPGLAGAPAAAVTAGVVLVLAGLLFEAGAAPAHFWVPDATQGSSTTAAAFLTTVPKLGAVLAVARLLEVLPDPGRWSLAVGALAVVSMTLGNLAALVQRDVRRLLAWSTVSQVGYLLAAAAVVRGSELAVPGLLVLLAGYAVTNLACFAVVAAEPARGSLADWRGLGRTRPGLVAALGVGLLGLVGTPPTGVFVGKLLVVSATLEAGQAWLGVAVLLNTVLSLAYYLRWLGPCLLGAPVPDPRPARGPAVVAAALAAVAAVGLGLLAGPLLLLAGG